MPRPISWLPRLHEISRSVANSVRSHYDRRDIEQLFELQPRAAQKLIELLAGVRIGTSRLIAREDLSGFLDRVRETEDTTSLFDELRKAKAPVSRRKPRSLVRRDTDPIAIESLPDTIRLLPGRMEVSFTTVVQLAEAMYELARVLESDGERFVRRFEPTHDLPAKSSDCDVEALYAELAQLKLKSQII